MTRRLPPRLVALSPGDLTTGAAPEFLAAARAAVAAGLGGILLREPALGDRGLLELAASLRGLLSGEGWLGIHDRVHLAQAAGADAVHLGFRSLAPSEARSILPEGIALGFSAHAEDDVSAWRASDYLFLGPVLDTPSKRGWKEPVGLEGLAAAVRRSPAPVWAIGGITPEAASSCLACGCAGVAARSGILGARDPASSCRAYLAALAA